MSNGTWECTNNAFGNISYHVQSNKEGQEKFMIEPAMATTNYCSATFSPYSKSHFQLKRLLVPNSLTLKMDKGEVVILVFFQFWQSIWKKCLKASHWFPATEQHFFLMGAVFALDGSERSRETYFYWLGKAKQSKLEKRKADNQAS